MKHHVLDEFWVDEDLRIKAIRRFDNSHWFLQYNLPGAGQRRRSLETSSKKRARLLG